MGLYEVSLASFRAVQQDRPEEFAVQVAIAETQLLAASSEAKEGFTDRAVQTLIDCLRGSLAVLQEGRASRIAWKLIGDALSKLGELAGEEDSEIRALIKDDILPKLQKDDVDSKNPLLTVMTTKLLMGKLQDSDLSAVCLASAVLCFSMRMLLEAQNEDAMGAAWHDIGHALQNLAPAYPRLGLEGDSEQVIMEAIQCIRNALQKEPLNGQYWSLLGVLAAENSPKLAQHSLIRACELNVRVRCSCYILGNKADFASCDYRAQYHGQILASSTFSTRTTSSQTKLSFGLKSWIQSILKLGWVKLLWLE